MNGQLMRCAILGLFTLLVLAAVARAGKIVVQLPDGEKATSAMIARNDDNNVSEGKIEGQRVTFDAVGPDSTHTAQIILQSGTVLQGVDLTWYTEAPKKKDAGKLTADDIRQILAVTTDIKSFYSSTEIIQLHGDHDRAVGLVRLIRDGGFYNDKGGEIIWRMEVWYFKFQYGGWEKVQQSNKVLRRERFRDRAEYEAATKHLKYVPELGGISLGEAEKERVIELTSDSGKENPPKVEEEEEE